MVLDVQQLRVERSRVPLVDGVSFTLRRGEALGLVGESGCGKTMTCLAVMGLLPDGIRVAGGKAVLEGADLLTMSEAALARVRGNRLAMVPQDPLTSLNPVMTVGAQVKEPMVIHRRRAGADLRASVVRVLERVRLPRPAHTAGQYPHQVSGGMRQRALIGIGLSCDPAVLIADEPTTALDVTTQARILRVLRDIQQETGASILLVTHNFGVVHSLCQRVAVMYAGRIVEVGPSAELLERPLHPYTRALLSSVPRLGDPRPRLETIPGQPPEPGTVGRGCRFATRCPAVMDICREVYPTERWETPERAVSCWLYGEKERG